MFTKLSDNHSIMDIDTRTYSLTEKVVGIKEPVQTDYTHIGGVTNTDGNTKDVYVSITNNYNFIVVEKKYHQDRVFRVYISNSSVGYVYTAKTHTRYPFRVALTTKAIHNFGLKHVLKNAVSQLQGNVEDKALTPLRHAIAVAWWQQATGLLKGFEGDLLTLGHNYYVTTPQQIHYIPKKKGSSYSIFLFGNGKFTVRVFAADNQAIVINTETLDYTTNVNVTVSRGILSQLEVRWPYYTHFITFDKYGTVVNDTTVPVV